MSAGNNFVDLRITNAGTGGSSEDSVWPAFTDIMTVVLMIFLISMVAFLIRNSQLVDELQTTLIEKDQISEQALLRAQQNNALETQLALVRERILALESSLETVTGNKDKLQQTLEAREKAAKELQTEIALLTLLRDQLTDSNSELLSRLDLTKQTLAQTETEFASARDTLGQKLTQLNLSERALNASQTELATSQNTLEATSRKLTLSKEALAAAEQQNEINSNTLNEKISLLLAAKAGLLVAKEETDQRLSDAEVAKLELNRKVLSLTEQLRLISDKLDTQTTANESLDSQLENQKTIMAGLSVSKEELEKKLEEMTDSLAKLQNLYQLRGKVVLDLQSQLFGGELQFKSLQQEYDSLDEQYRKLIRAARSPAGKYVVNVYMSKRDGKTIYRIKQPGQIEPQELSLDALHAQLQQLKHEHQLQLYTKIRIDEKSAIGFDEAWQFTQKILSKYDYYANDTVDPAAEASDESTIAPLVEPQ